MARTINGNLTGRAAATEIADWQEWLYDVRRDVRRAEIERAKLDFGDALQHLRQVDPEWESWFDDDHNIPPKIIWGNRRMIDELIARMNKRAEMVLRGREADLGSRFTIYGGEVMEMDAPLTKADLQGGDIPF